MGPIRTGQADQRHTWEPPIITKVAIGVETKAASQSKTSAGHVAPRPPSPPATKLGFAFEMAFPMSARSEQ
jgi:hypothetical protein